MAASWVGTVDIALGGLSPAAPRLTGSLRAISFGRYALLDFTTSPNVLPDGYGPTGEPNWTLDEIEGYLGEES